MKKIAAFFILFLFNIFFIEAQNTCASALSIASRTYTITNIDGSEVPNPICAQNGQVLPIANARGEWYQYLANADKALTVSTDLPINIGKDTRFHVYKGSCGSLICVSGDDDSGSGNLSIATFNVFAGQTYYIAFDNKWSSAGFDFTLSEGVSIPFNFTEQNITNNNIISCVVDMNNDYLDDVVSVATDKITIFNQQTNGTLTKNDYTLSPNVQIADWSIAAGDFDHNNYNDIALGNSSRVTTLKSTTNGTQFIVNEFPQNIFSQKLNFVDINNDGNLDLWACNDTAQNHPYKNDSFGNLSLDFPLIPTLPVGGNYSSVWTDYDNDGDIDLYISKCKGGVPSTDPQRINLLYKNNGNGTFTEVGAFAGVNDGSQTWATAIEDFDNDGDLDFLVSNVSDTNKFYKNNGNGTFTDVFSSTGIDAQTGSLEIQTGDFNNDGFIDFMWQNSKQIYINNGNLTFTGYQINVNEGGIGDLNNDGFLDIQYNNKIFYGVPNAHNWLKVNLKGIQSNSNGIGARVEIYGIWGKQIREIRSGQGFAHMSSLSAYFGIGNASQITKIIVKWPSGIVDTILNPNMNQAVLVVEGNHVLSTESIEKNEFILYPNPTKDKLYIIDVKHIKSIEVYNLAGQFQNIKWQIGKNYIDLSPLENGVYVVVIKTDQETIPKKVIKN